MRLVRHPVAQFLAVSLATILLISVVSGYLASRAAESEAIAEARRTNELLARSVAQPNLTRGLARGNRGAIDQFERDVAERLIVHPVVHVNIWAPGGRVAYSSVNPLIGNRYPLSADQRDVLAGGGTGSAVADPADDENRVVGGTTGLVRIYTQLRTANGNTLLFEGYYSLEQIRGRRAEILDSFRWITLGGPMLLVLLVTPMLWVLTRRLTHAAAERERLLVAAIDASDAERRRIARDLHDSVVQDLAGTAFSISAVARDPVTPPDTREQLHDAGGSLRTSLKGLRSLLAEIHPPELQAEGLPAALQDLTATSGSAGIQSSVSVAGTDSLSDEHAALIWRVAQEAVRNALRHSGASTLAVTVRGEDGRVVLEVVDDGTGFDATRPPAADSFGLRGLRSLVAEAEGSLDVRSSPGEGTRVRMEVDAR